MLIPTIIMGALAIIFLFIGYYKGQGQQACVMLSNWWSAAIWSAGELISKWIGAESGIRGIFIGTAAGALVPGGPYVSLPIAAGLLRCGAGIGTMVAFLAAWSLWSVARLPMEVGILGWKVTLIRVVCTFFFPPIAGLIAHIFFAGAK